jgi:hypothetical protein
MNPSRTFAQRNRRSLYQGRLPVAARFTAPARDLARLFLAR